MRGCASPGGRNSVACLNWQEEWKTRTIPQFERVTRDTGTEIQQDNPGTRVPIPQFTHKRQESATAPRDWLRETSENTDQSETGNDELEYPEEWTPAKRNRMKSNLLCNRKGRERRLPILNTGKVTSCGEWEQAALQTREKSDQPDESAVKEQKVDDIAMDQGPRDAGVTK